jgi:hypothetical protein
MSKRCTADCLLFVIDIVSLPDSDILKIEIRCLNAQYQKNMRSIPDRLCLVGWWFLYNCIVVVQKRSVIPTFFSTTTYAAIPYFET